MRQALGLDRMAVHYQPQVSLETGRITGAEALLRWRDPDLGAVSPAVFIPLAGEVWLHRCFGRLGHGAGHPSVRRMDGVGLSHGSVGQRIGTGVQAA